MPFLTLLLAAGAWAAAPQTPGRTAVPALLDAVVAAPAGAPAAAAPVGAEGPQAGLAPPQPAVPSVEAPAPAAVESGAERARPSAAAAADDGSAFFDGDGRRRGAGPDAAATLDAARRSFLRRTRRRALRLGRERELKRLAAGWHSREQLAKVPELGRGETFRLAWIGDAEEGRFWAWRALFNTPGMFMQVLEAADAEGAHLISQGGDYTSRGTERFFVKFFRLLEPAKRWLRTPLVFMPGNHDGEHPNGVSQFRLHSKYSGLGDQVLDRGDWRIVFLHTGNQRLGPAQLRWLDEQLDTPRHKLVLTHVPPAYVAQSGRWGPIGRLAGFRQGAEEFKSILEKRGVKGVVFGHVHGYDVIEIGGVRYTLSGGGGSALFPGPKQRFYHYVVFDLKPDGTIVKTVRPVSPPH